MDATDVRDLRQRLAARLKILIRNAKIEEKELAAFDLILSRRQFLKASQLAGVSALVAAGMPPTVWARARKDPDLKVCPQDVGLTDAEQASVGVAAQLVVGTELFQDTIYAQPVVSQEDAFSHAIVEGARPLLRLQSDLETTSPAESQFLDTGWHYGPTELIQVEQVDGAWELVHYHLPWGARIDGARTDSLDRKVILNASDGLTNPTKILTSTATRTNKFEASGSSVTAGFEYLIYVEQDNGAGANMVVVGIGEVTTTPPWSEAPIYPIRWVAKHASGVGINSPSSNYLFATKITCPAYSSPSDYTPENASDQIVLYYSDQVYILSHTTNLPGFGFLLVSVLPYPPDAPDARVVHADYQGPAVTDRILQVVMASSAKQTNGDVAYTLNTIGGYLDVNTGTYDGQAKNPKSYAFDIEYGVGVFFSNKWRTASFTVPAGVLHNGDYVLDYSSVRDVQGLYVMTPDNNYHVKLANFSGRGIVAFVLADDSERVPPGTPPIFYLAGHFPLQFPIDAGTILNFSGGVSKFGGLRFAASDEDGNLFLLRQRRAVATDSPYPPPIYGQFTADGEPISTYSFTQNPLPPATAAGSNLRQLPGWLNASFTPPDVDPDLSQTHAYNFLQSAALAFATDDTSSSQGVWLGSAYKAAYAPTRSAHDFGFVAVKAAQGSTDTYAAYLVHQNQVDKTWRQRQIATQVLPQGPGLQETGDHYQATITPSNVYGKPVSMLGAANQNLLIEVRADSPCVVIDDTNNLYYDVDRYTSFMAPPDPSSGHLCVLVKADVFSQVLYVRLVDTSGLQPSADAALLSSTAETVYPWQSANLALQAQQRMGNGAPASSLLGGDMPIADMTQYVSSDTLAMSNQDTPWQTKGNYQPSSSNLSSVADYLNSSGQNLISATGQLSLGAPNANGIDPLYAVTAVPSDPERDTVTSAFGYAAGSVSTTRSAPSLVLSGELGSIWGSISHALHDALQWLQNVEGDVYNDLGNGAVTLVSAVDAVQVTVSKEIMKQVNGVEQDLEEVVSTVEEYASVVANVVVTIVEQSFIFKYIELLIALISLFLHFKNILDLSKSLSQYFDDLFTGAGSISLLQVPSSFMSSSVAGPYLGAGNGLSSSLQGVQSTNPVSALASTVLDDVLANPLTKKILNKAIALVSNLLNEASPPLPFQISLDQDAANDALQDVGMLTTQLEDAIAKIAESAASQLVQDVAADLADPQATFSVLGEQLGGLVDGIATESLADMFSLMDTVAREGPTLLHDLISSEAYLTIDTAVLSDLCKLFGIGNAVGSKLAVSSSEAVFFPIALISWVAVYMQEGKSISSVDDLQGNLSLAVPLGGVDTTIWNYVRIVLDGVLQTLLGCIWAVEALANKNGADLSTIQQLFTACGSWFSIARWVNDLAYTAYKYAFLPSVSLTQYYDWGVVCFRSFMAAVNGVLTIPEANLNPGEGWSANSPRPTDITQLANFVVQTAGIGVDTDAAVQAGLTPGGTVNLIGQDIFRTQLAFLFLYNFFSLSSLYDYFLFAIIGAPATGAFMQMLALTALSSEPPGPGGPGHDCRGGRGVDHGRKTRRRPHGHPPRKRGGR